MTPSAALDSNTLNANKIVSVEQNNQTKAVNKNNRTTEKKWFGRCLQTGKEGAKVACEKAGSAGQEALSHLAALTEDIGPIASIGRKTDKEFIPWWKIGAKNPDSLKVFNKALKVAVGGLDAVQVVADLDYFVNGHSKKDNTAVKTARAAILVANASGTILWLEHLKFFNLAQVAEKIGNVRIFGFVPKMIAAAPGLNKVASLQRVAAAIGQLRVFSLITKLSLGIIASAALAVGHALYGLEALYRLAVKAVTKAEKIMASLDAISHIAEAAMAAMVIAGASIPALGAVAVVALAFGLSACIYRHKLKRDKERAELVEQKKQEELKRLEKLNKLEKLEKVKEITRVEELSLEKQQSQKVAS